MLPTRNHANVLSCGVPKVVNVLKKANSPNSVPNRDVNIGAAALAGLLPN